MPNLLTYTNCDVNFPDFRENSRKIPTPERVYENILTEAYGSFEGQFKTVNDIADALIKKLVDNDYVIGDDGCKIVQAHISTPFDCNIGLYWYENKYGDGICRGEKTYDFTTNQTAIKITTSCSKVILQEMAGTIAHEIMHVFQGVLPKVNGVNEKSMKIYAHISDFIRNAGDETFEYYFFYGMYICFPHERAANISSIANYLNYYFSDKSSIPINNKIINKQNIEIALKLNTKRQFYIETRNRLSRYMGYVDDFQYIENCLKTIDDPFYKAENFDIKKFVFMNVKNIIKMCDKTIEKMDKNVVEWIEQKKFGNKIVLK